MGYEVRLLKRGDFLNLIQTSRPSYDVAYVNLTDGLALVDVLELARPRSIVVTRLKSGDMEQGNISQYLSSVPADMLYRMATGQRMLFLDCGSRREDGLPRSVWQGLTLVLHLVHRVLWGEQPWGWYHELRRYLGGMAHVVYGQMGERAEKLMRSRLWQSLINRWKYYRRYATERPSYTLHVVFDRAAVDDQAQSLSHQLNRIMRTETGTTETEGEGVGASSSGKTRWAWVPG